MNCPYCNETMKAGFLLSPSTEPSYFMPEDTHTKGLIIEAIKLKVAEGLNSHYCPQCNYVIIKLKDDKTE